MASLGLHFRQTTHAFVTTVTYTPTAIQPPINVRATVLTPQSFEITWTLPPSTDITGYLISYTTTALYTYAGSVMVSGNSATSGILNNLEEGTTYTITVQATASNHKRSNNSNEVTVTTYTACK